MLQFVIVIQVNPYGLHYLIIINKISLKSSINHTESGTEMLFLQNNKATILLSIAPRSKYEEI
ncbi:hypothetical protein AB669_20520 [Pedobacter sp. BMA]|nr:hypothetical protein AB669_20520 [Pedobacter sp. BMA]